MIIRNQGNIGTVNIPIWKDWDNVLFTGVGGKPTMNLTAKNIPPMLANDLPDEIQIKESSDSEQSMIKDYDKLCQKTNSCHKEVPMFRFQIIYDNYNFLYYPECVLYERPFILLEANLASGSDTITVNTTLGINETKDVQYFQDNDIIEFIDYGDRYQIDNVTVVNNTYYIQLTTQTTRNYSKNDIIVLPYKKYNNINDSNITDGTTNITMFKFKFCELKYSDTNKNYILMPQSGVTTTPFILYNDDFTNIVDIQNNVKYVSLSKNVDINPSTITLNNNITTTNTEIEFTSDITNYLDVYSYFTLKTGNTIEIMKVIQILEDDKVKVEREQLGTNRNNFDAASTSVYFPLNFYFIFLPYTININDRYVLFRNIDFVNTQV